MAFSPYDSLVDSLGKAAKAAYPAIKSLAATAAPKQAILDFLKSQGISIRRQTGLDLIDLLRNKADQGQFIRTFGENAPLSPAQHRVSPTQFSGGAKYQYEVGTNSANEQIPAAIYVNSERPLSANEIYAKAGASFRYEEGSGMSSEDLADVVFTLDDARYEPGQQTVDSELPPPDYEIESPS